MVLPKAKTRACPASVVDDSPRPPNAAQVWNASPATNRGNLKPYSLRSLAQQISSRFSQKYFNLLKPLKYFCSPQTTLLLFGEGISPNPFLFAKSQFVKLSETATFIKHISDGCAYTAVFYVPITKYRFILYTCDQPPHLTIPPIL